MACPATVSPAPRNVAIASLTPATTPPPPPPPREPGPQAKLRRRPRQEAAEHGTGADARWGTPGVEPGEPRVVRGDDVGGILERGGGDPGEPERDVIPCGQEPGGPGRDFRGCGREPARRSEEGHGPAMAAERRRDRGRFRTRPAIQPGDRVPDGPAVRGRGHERGALPNAADRDRLQRAVRGGLRQRDRGGMTERVPPCVGILLGATRLAVEEQRVGRPGIAAQPAVEGDHAGFGGGGPEVQGEEGARVGGGHGGQW